MDMRYRRIKHDYYLLLLRIAITRQLVYKPVTPGGLLRRVEKSVKLQPIHAVT